MLSSADGKRLSELVFEHKVVFEVQRADALHDGERRQVGFDAEICGMHGQRVLEGHEPQPLPGCERCEQVWEHLNEIAQAVLPSPSETRPTGYYVDPYDHALRYFVNRRPSPGRDRPDVLLTIEIRHKRDYDREVDDCEKRCLDEIVNGLLSLGAQKRRWSDSLARRFQRDLDGAPAS